MKEEIQFKKARRTMLAQLRQFLSSIYRLVLQTTGTIEARTSSKTMAPKFQIISVPDDVLREQEQMGTKFKFWYRDDLYGYSLFKEGHQNTGEDWAERVVAELCELLEMPHANYKLATWIGRRGVISPNFLKVNEALVPGNQVLQRLDITYPIEQRRNVKGHNIKALFSTFEELGVRLPLEAVPANIVTAQQVFLGYLMLDAWIGNTDRHHENWALISQIEEKQTFYKLAPTHDHAASLGSILTDAEANDRLTTKDQGRTIAAYAQRGRSAIYETETDSKPLKLLDAFRAASVYNPDASNIWLGKMEDVNMDTIREVFERVPDALLSDVRREFAIQLLNVNRSRLLDLKI